MKKSEIKGADFVENNLPKHKMKLLTELADVKRGFDVKVICRRKRSHLPKNSKTPRHLHFMKISPVVKRRRDLYGGKNSCNNAAMKERRASGEGTIYADGSVGAGVNTNFCSICNVSYHYDAHYAKHCVDMHGIHAPFFCRNCEKGFRRRYNLVRHAQLMHSHATDGSQYDAVDFVGGTGALTCEICQAAFTEMKKFEKHAVEMHKGAKAMPWPCPHCDRKFTRRRPMWKHVRNKHADVDFKCRFCLKMFEKGDDRGNHEIRCEERRRKRLEANELNSSPTENESVACEECGEYVPSICLLRHYISKHPDCPEHPCHYCGETFANTDGLDNHVWSAHTKRKVIRKGTKKKERTCVYCGEHFKVLEQYQRHGKMHHGGKPMFSCGECDKTFAYQKSLKDHVSEKHMDDKIRCAYCPRCYHNPSRLRDHQKACMAKYEKTKTLQSEGAPCYYCHLCERNLYVKDVSFKSHISRHKLYDFCSLCYEGFHRVKNPNGLREHVAERHPLRENIEALLQSIVDANVPKAEKLEWKTE